MKTKTFLASIIVAIFLTITFTSCEKDNADIINVSSNPKIDFVYKIDSNYISEKNIILIAEFFNIPKEATYNYYIVHTDPINTGYLFDNFKTINGSSPAYNDRVVVKTTIKFIKLVVKDNNNIYECYKEMNLNPIGQ